MFSGYMFWKTSSYWLVILFGFLIYTSLSVIWLVVVSNILRPIDNITEYVIALQDGNLENTLVQNTKDEMGIMVKALNNLSTNIRKARDFTKNIGSGNYEMEILGDDVSEGTDSLFNSLIGMRNQLKIMASQEGKRNWVTKGMASFAEVLRSDDTDLKQMGNRIITGLVRYLEAGQGGLFVINKENSKNTYLELVATYGYAENQYLQRKIIVKEAFGEGLVGQAYLEAKSIYIKQVPQNYFVTEDIDKDTKTALAGISIDSGMGHASPNSLLVVPLELNGHIEGVVEIASFRQLQDYELDFVEKLAENIASAILTIKINDNTKKLLKESQELTRQVQTREDELKRNYEELKTTQELIEKKNSLIEDQKKEIEKALAEQNEKNEMLSAQEEEMRQNMEELVTTQEQMMATQTELDGQLKAINNSTIAKIEFDLDGIISSANQAYCNLMKYKIEDIKSLHHRIFIPIKDGKSEDFKDFWADLKAGIAKTGEFRRINKYGEEVWLNAVYSPVFDQNGKPYKVVKLAFDITEAKNLLQETQSQAKTLQAQGAELQQNMNALTATQEELKDKNKAIEQRAKEIENKNQLITSSILYAQNIQRAILPSIEKIKEAVQDFFVVYLPKDIVSGDFYWFAKANNQSFFAAVDCTGHGVPGAFMSIIGNTILNEIVNVQHIYEPSKILELLHEGVRTRLKQADSNNNDGMDLAICRIIKTSQKVVYITFAGAKRPMYYVKNTPPNYEMLELRGDRKSIGGWQHENYRSFDQQQIMLKEGDYIFLTTDGLMDNPNVARKKFGATKFKEIILNNITRSREELKDTLLEEIALHQVGSEQRDDITILGIKL